MWLTNVRFPCNDDEANFTGPTIVLVLSMQEVYTIPAYLYNTEYRPNQFANILFTSVQYHLEFYG